MIFFTFANRPITTSVSANRDNYKVDIDDFLHIISRKEVLARPPEEFDKLQELAVNMYAATDQAEKKNIKDRIDKIKQSIPYFVFTGYIPTGHAAADLTEYNSTAQIDIDFHRSGGERETARLIEEIATNPHPSIIFATPSPTRHGVKILMLHDSTDQEQHRHAASYLIANLIEWYDIAPADVDRQSTSISFTCYCPFLRANELHYVNKEAEPTHIPPPPPPTTTPSRHRHTIDPSAAIEPNHLSAAIEYIIQNRINPNPDDSEGRELYVKICAAIKHEQGEQGEQAAYDILSNSPRFLNSTFEANFRRNFKAIRPKPNGATGHTILKIAYQSGFRHRHAVSTTEIQQGERLSDTFTRTGFTPFGKFIQAPTGSGKTTAICKIASAENRIIFVVPTQAILEQQHAEYINSGAYYEHRKDTSQDLIFTTTRSFAGLCGRVDVSSFHVVLDEAHNLITDSAPGFRLADFRNFRQIAAGARTITYLSGTPIYIGADVWGKIEFHRFTSTTSTPTTAQIIESDQTHAAAAEGIRRSIERGHIAVMVLNDKGAKLAKAKERLKGYNVAEVNADTKSQPVYQRIVRSGMLPDDTTALICTSVIEAGNSIYDDRCFDFHFVGNFHTSQIRQMSARPRTAKQVNIYIHRSKEREQKHGEFNARAYSKAVRQQAERAAKAMNEQPRTNYTQALFYERILRENRNGREAIEQVSIIDPATEQPRQIWQVCELSVQNSTYQAETASQQLNDRETERQLKMYGIAVNNPVIITSPTETDEQKQALEQAAKSAKERRIEAHKEAIKILTASATPDSTARNEARKTGAPPAFAQFLALTDPDKFNRTFDQAIDILNRTEGNTKLFTLECRRIAVTNSDQAPEQERAIIAATFAAFKQGEQLSGAEIADRVQMITASDKSRPSDRYGKPAQPSPEQPSPEPASDKEEPTQPSKKDKARQAQAAIRYIRAFFDVTARQVKRDGAVFWVHTIGERVTANFESEQSERVTANFSEFIERNSDRVTANF